jgi:rare lipoprotein A
MLGLVGFTIVNEETKSSEPVEVEETENMEETTINTSVVNFIDQGEWVASWYGPRFHGRKTANGEIYDQMAMTAAHKKLRFGTLLKVTNPRNDKSVIVRINDRGPYIRGRHLDLSKAAAQELEIIERGVAKLNIEQISLSGVNFPVITLN